MLRPIGMRQLRVFAVLIPLACGARTADVCLIPAGTYVAHFTVVGAQSPCASIPDQMVTIEGDGAIAGGSTSADGGSTRCEISVGYSTCESSLICLTEASGIITSVSTTLRLHAGAVSGRESISTTNPALYVHCDYDITME